jgi:5-methyltetrahydropteroyltriglutamate--homocysteine methyltransferase
LKHSTDRILTTHVGSLARPRALIDLIQEKESGHSYDEAEFARQAGVAVRDVIRRQVENGIDVVNDGEQAKSSFQGYFLERLTGFERKPAAPGQYRRTANREYLAFKEFYDWAPGRSTVGALGSGTCTGPISYKGQVVLQRDLDNIKAGLEGLEYDDVFVPAIAATYVAATRPNEYYKTYEEYEYAVADAMREEYAAIIAAGFVVQLDDPRIISYYTLQPELSIEQCRKWAEARVEVINYSIRGLPEEQVRFHTCYSINIGPRVHEMELSDFIDIMLKIDAGAYSFEAANPRHEHDYHVFEDVKLPPGKVLIPGVISHTTNLVEHPALVSERIQRFAKLVGRENVIAGADCGFSTGARDEYEIHPSVVWHKFAALGEGARLASKQLWSE